MHEEKIRSATGLGPLPRLRLLSSALIAAWVPWSHSLAQTSPGPAALEAKLPAVNVTAKGHAADTLETPAAVLVLDREDLFRRGAANVGEALRGAPGLAVASDGAQGQNPVIRGLKRESVVLLVDGMRLNSAQPAGAIASFMSLGLADRVEVVKGPGSVLYGTGALGGVINVQLPQAEFTPGLRFRASAGYDSASQGLRAAGTLNASQDDHALMLGIAPAHQDDYRAPGGKVADTGYSSESLIAQYRWRLDPAQQLRVSLQQHTDRDVWYPGSAKPGMPPALGTVTVHSPRQQRSLAEIGYSFNGRSDWRFDARLYRQEAYREIEAFASALQRNQTETKVRFATDGIDLKADWAGFEGHLLTFGLNLWEMTASPERFLSNNAPLFNNRVRNDPFKDGSIRAQGLYLQDDMRFGALGVLAGLRHDRVTGGAASINNGAVSSGLERADSATSASLGLVYEAAPLLRPYANLSRAFRAGEMRERFEASPRGDGFFYLGNPQIRPEKATQFEVGLKGEDGRFGYALSAYRTRISDYITGRVTGAVQSGLPVKRTENIGRVTLQGAEAEGRWQFTRGHWARLGYSRIRANNDDLNEPLFQSPADELSLGWEGRLAGGWSADATLRLVRAQDRVATRFSNGTENATPGFVTADVGATYRWSKQSLRIAVKNLADKAYHEHLAEGLSGREIQAPGRSLTVSWKGEF
jgi:hemoglobin/transferrin/lactoferrin receptor protein